MSKHREMKPSNQYNTHDSYHNTLHYHNTWFMHAHYYENGGQKGPLPLFFFLHLHGSITIRLNVHNFSTRRFEPSVL